jgi:carboxyl-terminal processing protease
MSGLIIQFAFEYTDNNRQKLSKMDSANELAKYLVRLNTVELFANYADQKGLKRRNLMIQKSHKLLERYINSRIIYNMLSEEAWMQYLNQDDPAIRETLRVFRENKAFPSAPAQEEMLKKVA